MAINIFLVFNFSGNVTFLCWIDFGNIPLVIVSQEMLLLNILQILCLVLLTTVIPYQYQNRISFTVCYAHTSLHICYHCPVTLLSGPKCFQLSQIWETIRVPLELLCVLVPDNKQTSDTWYKYTALHGSSLVLMETSVILWDVVRRLIWNVIEDY